MGFVAGGPADAPRSACRPSGRRLGCWAMARARRSCARCSTARAVPAARLRVPTQWLAAPTASTCSASWGSTAVTSRRAWRNRELDDVVWGNQDVIDRALSASGETRSLTGAGSRSPSESIFMPVQHSVLLAVLIVALTSAWSAVDRFSTCRRCRPSACPRHRTAGAQLALSVDLLGFGFGTRPADGSTPTVSGGGSVMLWGMVVFVLSSAACALAPTMRPWWTARLVQAFGACVGRCWGGRWCGEVVAHGPHAAARVLSHVATATAPGTAGRPSSVAG